MEIGIRPDEITSILKKQIEGFERKVDIAEVGEVIQVGDGIARVYGLRNVQASELVEFPGGVMGWP
jgi:F-type H+-transporting ATPase subunit alpha